MRGKRIKGDEKERKEVLAYVLEITENEVLFQGDKS